MNEYLKNEKKDAYIFKNISQIVLYTYNIFNTGFHRRRL